VAQYFESKEKGLSLWQNELDVFAKSTGQDHKGLPWKIFGIKACKRVKLSAMTNDYKF
jgi:hypothetical protein